mmetsp:Transcript_117005/g.372414  ORF Transcript_117005/g.372414 Transcript_117005/m.372414 type:complete len:232 (+) Transcript_117005:930-1625(+)
MLPRGRGDAMDAARTPCCPVRLPMLHCRRLLAGAIWKVQGSPVSSLKALPVGHCAAACDASATAVAGHQHSHNLHHRRRRQQRLLQSLRPRLLQSVDAPYVRATVARRHGPEIRAAHGECPHDSSLVCPVGCGGDFGGAGGDAYPTVRAGVLVMRTHSLHQGAEERVHPICGLLVLRARGACWRDPRLYCRGRHGFGAGDVLPGVPEGQARPPPNRHFPHHLRRHGESALR